MGSLWNRSGDIERDDNDERAHGAKAFFFQGGTTTPLIVFQDAIEAAPHPNPLLASAEGRWPAVYVPFGPYDVQGVTEFGVELCYHRMIHSVDPTPTIRTIPDADDQGLVKTGMVHWEPINATRAGYVRANGGSIGNTSSFATEARHDTNTLELFKYLWNALGGQGTGTLVKLTQGSGHTDVAPGASAEADFADNKAILLPDFRGTQPVGLDTMGAVAGARNAFTGLTFTTGDANKPGSTIGSNSFTLSATDLPSHKHTVNLTSGDNSRGHTHRVNGNTGGESKTHTHSGSTKATGEGIHVHDVAIASAGVGGANIDITVSISDPGHTHDSSHAHGVRYNTAKFTPNAGGADAVTSIGSAGTVANNTETADAGVVSHTTGITAKIGSSAIAVSLAVSTVSNAASQHSHSFDTTSGANYAGGAGAQFHTHTVDITSDGENQNHNHVVAGDTGVFPAAGTPTTLTRLASSILGTWYIKL